MSTAADRAAIAAALTTITGITGYEKRPTAPKIGDAWPRWSRADRGPGLTFQYSWDVIVLLGNDEVTATDQGDALLLPLAEALEPVGFVDEVLPALITTTSGDILGLALTIRS